MIDNVKLKDSKELQRWYDNFYSSHGTYDTTVRYNRKMLDFLKIPFDKNLKLLDVACGGGKFLREAEKRVKTYGIDISKVAIKEAKKITRYTECRVGSAEKLPYEDEFFDFITCLGSLEHFLDMDKSLKEMKRVLKKDGKINLYVPNSRFLMDIILGFFGRKTSHGQENERFATKKEWKELIEKYFKIIKLYNYNPSPFEIIKILNLKGMMKKIFYPLHKIYFPVWIPSKYSYCYSFICVRE